MTHALHAHDRRLLSLAAALAISCFAAVPAQAQPPAPVAEMSAAAKKHPPVKRQRARRATGGRQIACTFYGCRPIPRNCRPVTGYDWWGTPTGYDDIACR